MPVLWWPKGGLRRCRGSGRRSGDRCPSGGDVGVHLIERFLAKGLDRSGVGPRIKGRREFGGDSDRSVEQLVGRDDLVEKPNIDGVGGRVMRALTIERCMWRLLSRAPAIVSAQSGSTILIATSLSPTFAGTSAPMRTSQPRSIKAPAASAWPVLAATTGTEQP